MANRFDVKTKTFFQIPPPADDKPRNVVFLDYGFNLDDIQLITECGMLRDLHYEFSVLLGYSSDRKIAFDFKRKQDCIAAQKELARAWTKTGEFAEDE